jgi:hypothetical protein
MLWFLAILIFKLKILDPTVVRRRGEKRGERREERGEKSKEKRREEKREKKDRQEICHT